MTFLSMDQGEPSDEGAQDHQRRVDELTEANGAPGREIAGRDLAEDEPRASELDVRLVIDGIPALVVVLSSSGQIDRLNQAALDYFGKTLEEVRKSRTGDLIHPHDESRVSEVFASSMASGEPFEVELRLRRLDGDYPWFLARALPLKDKRSRVHNWYVFLAGLEERKRVDDERRDRELSTRLLVESLDLIPAMAIIANEAGEIVFANQQVLDFFGRTLEDVRKWPASIHIVHPDDLEHANRVVAGALRAGLACQDEYRLQRRDGVYRWFEGRYSPVRDGSGRIANWCVLLIDIDDRKRSEARLRQSEAKLAGEKRMLELVAKSVGLQETLDELCRQAEAHIPASHCRILLAVPGGKGIPVEAGLSLPDSSNSFVNGVRFAADSEPHGQVADQKAALVTSNRLNERHWILPDALTAQGLVAAWSTPILSGGETRLGTLVVYKRDSEQPTAEQQEIVDRLIPLVRIAIERDKGDAALAAREADLRRANEFLTEAHRLNKTGSFTWDVYADEHIWSDEVHRIFGLDPDVRVTLGLIRTTIHPDDMAEVERVIGDAAEGRDFDLGFRVVTPNGELKYAHVVARRIEEITDRPVFVGAIQDVTEGRLAEENLTRARSELAHVARVATLNGMTASIAHEVSQPLSGIVTNANTCLLMLAADPPNLSGAAETARRAIRDANRASDMVNRLKAMFSKKALTTELVDLNDVVREVIALAAGELQRGHALVTPDFAESLPLVSADRVQLQQVVLNLVLNAVDAMAEIDDRPRTILIRTRRHDVGSVELHVKDSGVGVDPQTVEKMFDAFYTTKLEGMGVGLAISRSIIEAHHGRLWAEASDGPGATVSFRIPTRPPIPSPDTG